MRNVELPAQLTKVVGNSPEKQCMRAWPACSMVASAGTATGDTLDGR